MKISKRIWIVCIVIVIVFSLSVNALAIDTNETENNVEDIVSSKPITENDSLLSDDGISTMSIENPVVAYAATTLNSFATPDPATAHLQEVIPQNTSVWVVEKVWADYNDRYYYYVGYTYNGESHRGYVTSANVYKNGSQYLPENVPLETKPAGLKVHTSLAGTVYDGPATTYSVTGSVGQESIKLIRTEGDYNFIEYTVSSTGKLKRGFLHYSLITGSWENLTDQLADDLNGKTFYIKNVANGRYLEIPSASTTQRTQAVTSEFHGDTHQIFKFTYYADAHCFKIQPAHCYDNDMLLTQSILEEEHSGRDTMLYPRRAKTYQRYWIVKQNGSPTRYKIVAVSSYGTMTLATQLSSGIYNVCQDYTQSGSTSSDLWQFEPTTKMTSAQWVWQQGQPWCWAAAAKSMASCEEPEYYGVSLSQVVNALLDEPEKGGAPIHASKAANFFLNGEYKDKYFRHFDQPTNYSETVLRKLIMDDHAIWIAMKPVAPLGHALTIVGFTWNDNEGVYYYYLYDSNYDPKIYGDRLVKYETLRSRSAEVYSTIAYWQNVVAYREPYAATGNSPLFFN